MLSCSRFPLRSKKVCYKVPLCDNCQRQSCKAFIGLTNRANMIGGSDPFYLKFWIKMTALERNRRFSFIFARSASSVTPSVNSSINTNRKSHTGFRLVPTSMTLNDLERRNSPYFAFFQEIRQIFRSIISQWLKIDL